MQREFTSGVFNKAASSFTGNNSGNAPVFLQLGRFKFSLNTAMFQAIEQSNSYRWPAQERFGQLDALQYTGLGDATMTLPGVIYPQFKGTGKEMKELRAMAAEGKPLRLVTGTGGNLGMWVIQKVDANSTGFTPALGFLKQEFTIFLRKYSDGATV